LREVVPDSPEVLMRFRENLDLVTLVARQVAASLGSGIEFDDLLAFGREGLLDAARRFDSARAVPFKSYANYRVRGAILDGARRVAPLPRRTYEKIAASRAASLVSEGELEFSAAVTPAGPEINEEFLLEHLAGVATAAAISLAANAANSRSSGELTLAFAEFDAASSPEEAYARAELTANVRAALADLPAEEAELVRRHYFEGENLEVAGEKLGISKSWASRLHARAVHRLSKRLRALG
jgi:RNA polymerase sigma factor for flagellar operon FliA